MRMVYDEKLDKLLSDYERDGKDTSIISSIINLYLSLNSSSLDETNISFPSTNSVPTGAVFSYISDTAPSGYLICNGSAISRANYSTLFSIIGTTYGVGNGTTTFNIPDLRGRVTVGKSSDTEFDNLAETGGEKSHTLSTGEMPTHNHTSRQTYALNNGTSLGVNGDAIQGGLNGAYGGVPTTYNAMPQINTGNAGSGGAHNNIQPYQVINFIIKF